MDKFEEVGRQIVAFLDSPGERAKRLLLPGEGSRFVLCGTSGSGKTSAISFANELLPATEQIAESQELARERCPDRAMVIFNDEELAYEDSRHIGLNVLGASIAMAMEGKGIKVFWVDAGLSYW